MIKDIEIENFRCFEHTKIESFERVNLIGGKNNSGKTALLEAILLNQSPQHEIIFFLRNLRQEVEEFARYDSWIYEFKIAIAYPGMVWDSLFFNRCKNKETKIITKSQDLKIQSITLSTKKHESVSEDLEEKEQGQWFEKICSIKKPVDLSLFYDKYGCILTIDLNIQELSKPAINFEIHIMATSSGFLWKSMKENQLISSLEKVEFVSSYYQDSGSLLAKEYEQSDLENKSKILDLLKILDPSIESMTMEEIGQPKIYLKRSNQNYLSISLFGDAINKITRILLKLINSPNSILLIDEIENGIHYTNHRDFWKALFELSKELNVQIFATTHSLEMIKAFRDVGLEYYPDSGAYFEMARNPRTNNIVGIKHELEMLDYALKRNEGVRGE